MTNRWGYSSPLYLKKRHLSSDLPCLRYAVQDSIDGSIHHRVACSGDGSVSHPGRPDGRTYVGVDCGAAAAASSQHPSNGATFDETHHGRRHNKNLNGESCKMAAQVR
jgi:hypothetical protein